MKKINKMKLYQAIQYGDQNKLKEHFFIYKVVKKGKEYNFCFRLLEHAAFMNTRATDLTKLIEDAIVQYPQEEYFEYTGSHFEPAIDRSWINLPWEEIRK